LDVLARLKLIRKEPDGRWALTEDFVDAGKVSPTAVREHQKEMLRLAEEAIDRHPPEIRQVSSATFTLSLDDLEEVRRRVRSLRDSLLRMSSESKDPEHVFQFEAVVFPLTRVAATRRKESRK
jgi:uncharacterized protein (TIGR02147 family)